MKTKVGRRDIEVGTHGGNHSAGIALGYDEPVEPLEPGIVGGLSLHATVMSASGRSIYAFGVDHEFHGYNVNPPCDTFRL